MKDCKTYRITVPVYFEIEAESQDSAIDLALEILRDTDVDFEVHSKSNAGCTSMGWPEPTDPEIGACNA